MNGRRLAIDVDARVLAWIGGDAVLRVAEVDDVDEAPIVHHLSGNTAHSVVPGAGPGEFLAYGPEGVVSVRWSGDEVRTGPAIPCRSRLVTALPDKGAGGPAVCTDQALLTYDGGGWRERMPLPGIPVLLARQARRRALLVVTRDGTISRFTPETGATQTARQAAWAEPATVAYDEILGSVWLAHPGGRPGSMMVRVEPWPPRAVYQADLGADVRHLTVAQNGEWLAIRRGPDEGLELYNVSGARTFRPPLRTPASAVGVAFTYDNRLVAVGEDDQVAFARLPARVDVRADGDDLDIEIFWAGRMNKASRPRRQLALKGTG